MATSTVPTVYPVHVDAELDPQLSRGLWLVKWILAIPHYVVLAFLWIAFLVTSIVAFFSILFTGRDPRSIFEFNVGVLRWTWRVAFYAYGALGTDRYPPFTLADVPDYPAHLEVEYPDRLSRGLVLVKWWLLAIPQYIVVGLFVGGAAYTVRGADEEPLLGFSLIGILVLVAGFALLFTGRYPERLFDLLIGLNRWVLRVAGYVSLMTDRYPPFSLDQGGHEAGVAPAAPPPPPRTHSHGWTAGRVVALVAGSVLVLSGLGVAAGGTALVVADQLGRDDQGFLMSPNERLNADGFAITSQDAQVHTDGTLAWLPDDLIGDVKVSAEGADGADLFVGIAPAGDAEAFLDGVRHDTLLRMVEGVPVYLPHGGSSPATSPIEETFWVAQATGEQPDLTWTLEDGDWTVVLMNADGSAGISADVSAGAEVPWLSGVIAGLFVLAVLLLAAGTVLIVVPVRGAGNRAEELSGARA
jgi:hypothetical protein